MSFGTVSKATPRQTDLIKKKLCAIFSKNGLRITIDANKQMVNFLDVTLDLKNVVHTEPFIHFVFHRNQHVPQVPKRIVIAMPSGTTPRSAETDVDVLSNSHWGVLLLVLLDLR